MKHFMSLNDVNSVPNMVELASSLKSNPLQFESLGKHKTIGLLFFNPSLRTRLSTQKAAKLLGLEVMIMNFSNEAWAIEYEDGTIMSGLRSEHIKEAAQVVSQYCDIIGIRAFASLTDKFKDENEQVLERFKKYADIPVVNMESATAHPLQALADALTLKEHIIKKKPKVVLTWAPHPKALPHAVANSFIRMMEQQEAEFVITHPREYALNPDIVKNVKVYHNQEEAFQYADVVYAKNWCSYENYGKVLRSDNTWMVTANKMRLTNEAKFMHCLPVRRNVVVDDEVLDSPHSLVIAQANNRTFAAQAVLKKILDHV